jgi:hypothetical protein
LDAEQIKEDFHHCDPLAGVGVTSFGQDDPNDRNPDAAINDREHQDVEIDGADFPVRPIQRQRVRPRHTKQPDYKLCEFGVWQLELAQEALQSFVVRVNLRRAGEGIGQDREIDGLHGVERQKKTRDKFDARLVPR